MANTARSIKYLKDADGERPVLLLSVQNSADSNLIKDYLPEELSVKVIESPFADHSFDLCIMDEPSFERNKKILKAKKAEAAPVFLPILVLAKDTLKTRNNSLILEFADDVIYMPVSTKVMQARILMLLQQRRYSDKLEQEKDLYKLVTENATEVITRHDLDGTILFASKACKDLLGYEPEELVGQNPFNLIHGADKKALGSSADLYSTDRIKRHTFRIQMKNGAYIWVEKTIKPIFDEDKGALKEIQASTRDISEQKKYEKEMQRSLTEKNTLLQEIHHRVKNNLAVVSGMLDLQSFNTENEEVKKLLDNSTSRVKTMGLIHEKLYQSKSLSKIDFKSYSQQLIDKIQTLLNANDGITIDIACDSFTLNVNQAVPCALILNEVVSNSLEHAFDEESEGYIQVDIQEKEDTILVIVTDSGPGLPREYSKMENKSLGFTIIETLLKQLNADHTICGENGFRLTFSFEKLQIKGSTSAVV